MKRNWVVTAIAATLIAVPAAAQTPQTQPPATTAQPASPPQSSPAAQASSADEHLRAAAAALNDVQVANLSARAKTQVNELKRRLTTLERAGASKTPANANAKAAASRVNWGTEVAAMDKVLTSLLGAESTATGTAGATTKPTGTTGAPGKAAAAVTLDETSRAKLTEVRTHITAYAAAMAGAPKTDAPATATDPAAAATPTTPAATPTPATAQPPVPTDPPAGTQPPAGTTPQSAAAATPSAGQPDMDTAKRHLTEARNSLSALTQLPAAAQLAGEARTQVSQLITNFNELITTQSNWRESYGKVNANMTSLLGADGAAVAAATGTAGAVGTSGSSGTALDPTIREKLVEMRKHLAEFEKAASGGVTTTPTSAANVEDPPTTPPNTPPATSATTQSTPTPTGTTGTTPTTAASDPQKTAQADWMRHVTAIEAMLKSQDESGGLTLDKAKVEMLRTHLAELRKLLERR